jgi:prophage regulatory protein
MMRLDEVVKATGLSSVTIWRRERDGNFPKRRRLGPNAVGWRSDEIEAWIESLPVADVGNEIRDVRNV